MTTEGFEAGRRVEEAFGQAVTSALVEKVNTSMLNLCPACHQPLVSCLGCGRMRGAWKDPTSLARYCSPKCKARIKKRRHRQNAAKESDLTEA